MSLDSKTYKAWKTFLDNDQNLGHVYRSSDEKDMLKYVTQCYCSALSNVVGMLDDVVVNIDPIRILEVGCSTGMNCFALKKIFPEAIVVGVDPEFEAIDVANTMRQSYFNFNDIYFVNAVGENLPFFDDEFDLIICTTVIEHVDCVEDVIFNISRVLNKRGYLFLDAPNYNFPFEPHLEIFTLPCSYFGKNVVKKAAILQGKRHMVEFLNHLNFISPSILEENFQQNQLEWINRAEKKIDGVLAGDMSKIRKYKKISNVLSSLNHSLIARIFVNVVKKLRIYPSVMYVCYHKKSC